MPFFRRDKGRGRGSSREKQELKVFNRRSLTDFIGLDTSGPSQAAAPSSSHHRNVDFGGEGSFRWNEPGSPDAGQTPRGFVPSSCFPPSNSAEFASYSESAEIGIEWHGEVDSTQMTTLVASLESMKMRSQSTRSLFTSAPQSHSLSYDQLEKTDQHCARPVEQAGTSANNDRSNYLARRASYGGKTSSRDFFPSHENTLVWDGVLPPRCADPEGGFSAKVFLGGLPWDINEQALMKTLKSFHPNRVEWPGRDSGSAPPRGYAYVTFENERRVRALLSSSRYDGRDWYYRITSRKMRNKEVQVIPWAVSDSNWVSGGSARLEPSRTVFVGALHGMITAAGLAIIMNDLFPGVIYAGIDTDKNKYPIGSGRVTFNNVRSYVRAISAAFIEIHTSKFTKKVQVDPYLEDSMCSVCKLQQGPYFCREPTCFGYFCRSCWTWSHSSYANENHRPLMRCSKNLQQYTQYLHSAALPALQALPALPALPAAATHSIAALESKQIEVFNGGYAHDNEGTLSPPGTGRLVGGFSAMNGTS